VQEPEIVMPSAVDDESTSERDRLVALARVAGRAILDVKLSARDTAVEKSQEQGPVTAADLAADVVLREGLARLYPDDTVITEETWSFDAPVTARGRVWFVDPLDGTREFVAHRDEYAVMIGLVDDGRPRLGVVHQPETGVTWFGDVTQGRAFRVEADDTVHARNIRGRALERHRLRVAVSRSHKSEIALAVSQALDADTVECGSVGLKVALLVDSVVDAYLSGSSRIKMWDTAGPAALLLAAGGHFTALDGLALHYTGSPSHGAGIRAISDEGQRLFGVRIDTLVADMKARLARDTSE
jgi:3'(2'), 5'-bisphosphate nucleotidase